MDFLSSVLFGSPSAAGNPFAVSSSTSISNLTNRALTQQQPAAKPSSQSVVLSLSPQAQEALAAAGQTTSQTRTAPNPEDIFAKLDANTNGVVSEAEFVEGRPGFASEEQAAVKFAQVDTNADGVATEEELSASAPQDAAGAAAPAGAGGKPPPPPPPASDDEEDLLSALYDELDTNEDGVVDINELMEGLQEAAEEADAQNDTARAGLAQAFSEAISAYSGLSAEATDETASAIYA